MNQKVKIFGASLLAALCMLPFAACGDKAPEKPGEQIRIEISESAIEMNVGEERKLTVKVTPSDVEDKKIEWSSSDAGVASVENGTVKAKTEGETTITATTNGKNASCKVTVKDGGVDKPSDEEKEDVEQPEKQEPPDGSEENSDPSAE